MSVFKIAMKPTKTEILHDLLCIIVNKTVSLLIFR